MKSPWQFFMSFRGPKAHPNRRHKVIVCPTSLTQFDAVALAVIREANRGCAALPLSIVFEYCGCIAYIADR